MQTGFASDITDFLAEFLYLDLFVFVCVVAFPPVLNQFQVKARVSVKTFLGSVIFHQVFFLVQWIFTSHQIIYENLCKI